MAINVVEDGDVLYQTDWESVITTVENTTTGHDHDGTDSKLIPGNTYTAYQNSFVANGADEAEIDSYTFAANELTAADWFEVEIFYENCPVKAITLKSDANNILSVSTISSDGYMQAIITQSRETAATKSLVQYSNMGTGEGTDARTEAMYVRTNVAFATGFKVSLNYDADSNTTYWNWKITVHKAP